MTADIDTMHIRLLALLQRLTGHQGWSYQDVVDADAGLAPAARALLGTLEVHGLVESRQANRVAGTTGSTQFYTGTSRAAPSSDAWPPRRRVDSPVPLITRPCFVYLAAHRHRPATGRTQPGHRSDQPAAAHLRTSLAEVRSSGLAA